MKKFTFILSTLLAASLLLAGCGKDNDAAPASSSSASNGFNTLEAGKMPETTGEIIKHNDSIDPASINLIQFDAPASDAPVATIKTSMGDIKVVLYPNEAPKTVEQFTSKATSGDYNNSKFGEVVPSVQVTNSDKNGTDNKEYSLNLWHFNGAVAMSAEGSFYIVQNSRINDDLIGKMVDAAFPEKVCNQYLKSGGVPNYDFRDTVFGQVIEGMEIVEKIAAVERDASNAPKEDVTITAIEVA